MVMMNMIFWILLFLGFSSSLVSSQLSDSCSSSLSVSHLIPFNTSSFNCFSAWNSEGFIMRYAETAATGMWSFVLSAPDSGTYISVGFSADGFMVGSSAVAGWVSSSGVGMVRQYYLGGKSSSSCPPGQGSLHLAANSSLIVSQSSRLYLAFQLTNTAQPQPYLIYAVGPSDSLPSSSNYYLPRHQNQASASVNYATGVGSTAGGAARGNKRWHGILAAVGWGILMPAGIMMARYFKQHDPFWFYSHISIQGVGFVLGAAGVFLGFGLGAGGNADTHKDLGIAIFVFGILQVLAFLIRPDKASKVRKYWNWYHYYVGWAAVACAIANVFVGLSLAHESSSWSVFFGVFVGVWAFACAALEVLKLWMSN